MRAAGVPGYAAFVRNRRFTRYDDKHPPFIKSPRLVRELARDGRDTVCPAAAAAAVDGSAPAL